MLFKIGDKVKAISASQSRKNFREESDDISKKDYRTISEKGQIGKVIHIWGDGDIDVAFPGLNIEETYSAAKARHQLRKV